VKAENADNIAEFLANANPDLSRCLHILFNNNQKALLAGTVLGGSPSAAIKVYLLVKIEP
jgi:hypothetical protein